MTKYVVKDGGEKQVHDTGAMRDRQEGKARPGLVDARWLFRLLTLPAVETETHDEVMIGIARELSNIQRALNPEIKSLFETDADEALLRLARLVSIAETYDAAPGLHPTLVWRLGQHMALGALKYDDDNWRKGFRLSRTWDSLMRHMIQWELGEDDPLSETYNEPTEDHTAAVLFNLMALWCHRQDGHEW